MLAEKHSFKILISSFTFPPAENGVAFAAYNQAKILQDLGCDVDIVTGINNQPISINSDPLIINAKRFNVYGQLHRGGYKGETLKYRDFIKIAGEKYDVIIFHCWYSWVTDLAFDLLDQIKSKKIFISHGMPSIFIRNPKSLLRWLFHQQYVRKAFLKMRKFDHIVFLSDKADKGRFYDFYLIKKNNFDNYSVIPNVPTLDIIPDDDTNSIKFKEKYGITTKYMILYVSDFNLLKNQKLAIEVLTRIKLAEISLVLIGSAKNDYSIRLEKLLKNKGLTEKVHILYNIPRVYIKKAYKEADLFLFTSLSEVQPLVIIDSLWFGLPFISLKVGMLDRLPGGIVCNNEKEIVYNLIKFFENFELRKRLSIEGFEYARRFHNRKIISEMYNKLLGKMFII